MNFAEWSNWLFLALVAIIAHYLRKQDKKVDDLHSLHGQVNAVANQLREIKTKLEELRKIETEVAVIRHHLFGVGAKPKA